MADLIDRKKIEAKFEPWLKVQGYSEGELNMLKVVLYEISVMPSAQPDVPDTTFGNMISRQAAIDTVRSYYDECDEREESIEERIAQLPSVDELAIVTEYCRKRDLVLITMESFRVLQAYYNRQNGTDGEQDG